MIKVKYLVLAGVLFSSALAGTAEAHCKVCPDICPDGWHFSVVEGGCVRDFHDRDEWIYGAIGSDDARFDGYEGKVGYEYD